MSSASKMDPPATTQDHNSQPKLSTGAAQAPTTTEAPPSTTTAGASFNTETNLLSADLDSAHLDSQNNLQHFPLQGNLPAHLNLLPLLPQDGGVYSADVLMNMPMMMPMMMDTNGALPGVPQSSISADEIALYDRQIRLWGMQAQQKIRNANVLLISMKALANEIAKNLVLAGIGSLTIIDHEAVTEADMGAQFFLSEEDGHLGMNRAEAALPQIQKLNPRVNIMIDTQDVRTKGASYFAPFDMVIATDLDPGALNIINTATRLNMRPFYAAGSHGLYGFIFADLIEHTYVIEKEKSNMTTEPKVETKTRMIFDVKTKKENGKTIEMISKKELYSTWLLASDGSFLPDEYTRSKRRLKAVSPVLSCLRALWEFQQTNGGRNPGHNAADLQKFTRAATQKHKELGLPTETLRAEFLRSFLQNIGSEIAPVTAILGGQLAQDVINVLGQTQQPIQNTVIFDGNAMEATQYPLHPDGPLGNSLLSLGGIPGMGMGNGDLSGLMGDPSMMNMAMPMDMSGMVDFSGTSTTQ